MENNETYKITLADGTIIDNLILNGNNYITTQEIDESKITSTNFHTITINDIEYNNMTLRNFWKDTDGYHIVISELTAQEKFEAQINAKLDYIAMMEDIEL